jgi:hypothetical protein
MLDLGARGLEFFELFLPAARRLGYETRELADYYARFDAERGMQLKALGRDVDTLGRGVDAARTELDEQEKCVVAVRGGWRGIAAAAAVDAADRQNAHAAATVDRIHGLAEVMFEANLTLSAAVTNKVYKVVSLHQSTVGGYSAAQIDVLAHIYADGKDGDDSVAKDAMEDASYWFPELADDDYRHVNGLYKDGGGGALRLLDRDDVVRRAAGITKDWFDANFRHVYEEKQQEFTAACADCTEAVNTAYDTVIAEARSVEVQPGFRPQDTPDPALAPTVPEVPNTETATVAASAPDPGTVPSSAPPLAAAPVATPPGAENAATGPMAAAPQPATAPPPTNAPSPATASPLATAPAVVTPPTAPVPAAPAAALPVPAPTPAPLAVPGGLPGLGSVPAPGDLVRQTLAGGLADLGGIIRPLIEDTLSALTHRDEERHDEDLGDDVENPGEHLGEPAHDGTPADSLEVNLDGKAWTLAVDVDGQGLHLEMSDGAGGTARFAVEIGPDGLPRIVGETPVVGEDSVGAAPAEPTPESPVTAEGNAPDGPLGQDGPVADRGVGDAVPGREETPPPVPGDETPAGPQPLPVAAAQ